MTTGSYYAPVPATTVGVWEGQPTDPKVFSGRDLFFAVAEDMGRRVAVYKNGVRLWYRDYLNSWPRALDYFEGKLYVGDGTTLIEYDPLTSNPTNSWNLALPAFGSAPAAINSIKLTKRGGLGNAYVAVCFNSSGVGTVKTYKLSSGALNFHWSNPHVASYPRGAVVQAISGNELLFVSDTFNHEVYAVDFYGSKQQWTKFYYPNTICLAGTDTVRVAAEHENRVVLWNRFDGVNGPITVEFSAPVSLYSNPSNRYAYIVANQASTASTDVTYTPRKSQCAKEYSGNDTLYSVNSAFPYSANSLIIADTDNHRVIEVENGVVVAEVSGFNNPVTAVALI